MGTNQILSPQKILLPTRKKAAVPRQGIAAFSCSTGNLLMYGETQFPDILHQCRCHTENGDLYNLLQKSHYFSASLAEHPVSLVIIVEGINKPLHPRG